MGILSSLVDLLRQASDETLHLVLETLQSAIKSGGEQSTLIEPIISPIILDVWAQHIADPFISIDAVEVLEFLGHQECSWMLTATCVTNPPNNRIHFRETQDPVGWTSCRFTGPVDDGTQKCSNCCG
jgi:hypothetical protein